MFKSSLVIWVFAGLIGCSSTPSTTTTSKARGPAAESAETFSTPQGNAMVADPKACDCDCQYTNNKCEDFKSSLPQADKSKILSCNANQSADPDDPIIGCLHGVYDSTILPLLNIGDNIAKLGAAAGKVIEDDQACNADKGTKLLLLRTVAHAYEPEMIKIMVNKWTCGQINLEVQHRETAFYKSIDEKKVQFMGKLDEVGISLKPQDFEAQFHAQLTEKEMKFLSIRGPQEDPAEALKRKYGNIWNCYSRYERIRLVCDDATSTVLALAATYGITQTAFRAARAADGAAEASTMAKSTAAYKQATGRGDWSAADYIARHSQLPDTLIGKLARFRNWSYTGYEVTYRNPFPGAESMSVYMNKATGQAHFSIFLGWGRTTAARNALVQAARDSGFSIDTSPRLLPSAGVVTEAGTGFVGTSDAEQMERFLRRVAPSF